MSNVKGERIEVYRDHAGEYRWRWVAANNSDNLADSGEGYKNKNDLVEAAEHIRGERDIPIIDAETGERLDAERPMETLPGEVGERLTST